MKHEVPKPSRKMTLLISDENYERLEAAQKLARDRYGAHVPAAVMIDVLLRNTSLTILARCIAEESAEESR
jgi:hypothetical protein